MSHLLPLLWPTSHNITYIGWHMDCRCLHAAGLIRPMMSWSSTSWRLCPHKAAPCIWCMQCWQVCCGSKESSLIRMGLFGIWQRCLVVHSNNNDLKLIELIELICLLRICMLLFVGLQFNTKMMKTFCSVSPLDDIPGGFWLLNGSTWGAIYDVASDYVISDQKLC